MDFSASVDLEERMAVATGICRSLEFACGHSMDARSRDRNRIRILRRLRLTTIWHSPPLSSSRR